MLLEKIDGKAQESSSTGALGQKILAVWGTGLLRSVALNCPTRQWAIISAGWKWDRYLPAGVGLHRLSPYPSDWPQGLFVTVLSHLLCWRPNKTIKVCEEDRTEMCTS